MTVDIRHYSDVCVRRWDTCAGEAILRASGAYSKTHIYVILHVFSLVLFVWVGGVFCKLSSMVANSEDDRDYVYLPSTVNTDTPASTSSTSAAMLSVAPYANIRGLFALSARAAMHVDSYRAAVAQVSLLHAPKYM